MFHGQGKQTWPTGESYEGFFQNGEMTGYGVYLWPNGDRYEGDVVKGLRSGMGTFKWADGTVHRGKWKNGERDGDGVEYSKDGSVLRSGQWSKNKFVVGKEGEKNVPSRELPRGGDVNRIPIVVSNCLEKGLRPGTKEFSSCIAGS
jgi:hypothetical protein